jgi:hypothetical protein
MVHLLATYLNTPDIAVDLAYAQRVLDTREEASEYKGLDGTVTQRTQR